MKSADVPVPRHETDIGSFFVSLSSTQNITQSSMTVIFDEVRFDPGTEYNIFTGHFRCPLNGTYVFHSNVGFGRQYVGPGDIYIRLNGAAVGGFLPRNNYGSINTASTMTVVHCTAGDAIWVQGHMYSSTLFQVSGTLSTFSGFLLNADFV
jgi:hypothetical protein